MHTKRNWSSLLRATTALTLLCLIGLTGLCSRPPLTVLAATAATNVYVPIFNSENSLSNINLSIAAIAPTTTISSSTSPASNSHDDHYPPVSKSKVPSSQKQHHNVTTETLAITELTENLETKLKSIRNSELGIPFLQEIFDTMEFVSIVRNDSKLVAEMAERLSQKLTRAIRVLNDTRRFIRKNVHSDVDDPIFLESLVHPCPLLDDLQKLDQHYDKRQIEIKNWPAIGIGGGVAASSSIGVELFFDGSATYPETANFTANHRLNELIKSVNYSELNLKQIYFLSKDDLAGDEKCRRTSDDMHLRHIFASTIKQKNIVIIIDHGSSLNADQLDLTKTFANTLISMLNERDQVAIIATADKTSFRYTDDSDVQHQQDTKSNRHRSGQMYSATADNKVSFMKFVDSLNGTKDITNHSLAFQNAFTLLREIYGSRKHQFSGGPVQVMYISRGLVSPLTEAKSVLEAIAHGQKQLDFPVIINTCAIVLDEKRVMYEKQFLKDVAVQNYTKYNMDVSELLSRIPYNITGQMFVINKRHPEDMIKTTTAIFSHWFRQKSQIDVKMMAHLPTYVESTEKDMIISISQPCEMHGIIGVDMYLSDIAEDVMYYDKYQDAYAFIIDMAGYAIMHPSYPRPMHMRSNPFSTDIKYLEQVRGFQAVRERLLTEITGVETISSDSNEDHKTITYSWRRANHFYVVCIVTIKTNESKQQVQLNRVGIHYYQPNDMISISGNLVPELVYHRIDLIPIHSVLCKHFKQLATMESITLFLSASSFTSPFVYLKNNRDGTADTRIHNAKSIMAYIKDTTNLLANPGLLPLIRNDVTALFHIMSYLKKQLSLIHI